MNNVTCSIIWKIIRLLLWRDLAAYNVYETDVNKLNIPFDVIKGVGFINIYLNHDLNERNKIVLAFSFNFLTH